MSPGLYSYDWYVSNGGVMHYFLLLSLAYCCSTSQQIYKNPNMDLRFFPWTGWEFPKGGIRHATKRALIGIYASLTLFVAIMFLLLKYFHGSLPSASVDLFSKDLKQTTAASNVRPTDYLTFLLDVDDK